MPRLHHVAKARYSKKPRKCTKCGCKIKQGDSYFWFANRMGRISVRKDYCQAHRPRPSDMTTSDKLSRLYAAQEFVEDALRGEIPLSEWDDYKAAVAEALNNAAQEAREVGEEYTSSRDNMPEGLQNAGTGEELEQKAQSCEDWADALESAASSVEGMDAPEPDEPAEGEEADPDPEVPTTEIDDEASNAIGGLEL